MLSNLKRIPSVTVLEQMVLDKLDLLLELSKDEDRSEFLMGDHTLSLYGNSKTSSSIFVYYDGKAAFVLHRTTERWVVEITNLEHTMRILM